MAHKRRAVPRLSACALLLFALLLDASGSMFASDSGSSREKFARLAAVKEAVSYFLTNSHPSNEYFLVAFNQSPQVLIENTTRADRES